MTMASNLGKRQEGRSNDELADEIVETLSLLGLEVTSAAREALWTLLQRAKAREGEAQT